MILLLCLQELVGSTIYFSELFFSNKPQIDLPLADQQNVLHFCGASYLFFGAKVSSSMHINNSLLFYKSS